MRARWVFGPVLAAGLSLAGVSAFAQSSDADWLARCKDSHGDRYRHCEVRPVSLAAGPTLRVDAEPNGGVRVKGWDQPTVAGSARIQVQADSEAEARQIAGRISIEAAAGTIRATGPRLHGDGSWSASFVLSAPRRLDLDVETVNGPVEVADITGRIRATTTNGPLSLDHLGGDVRARTTNGPLTVALTGTAWDGAGLDAETTNGPVTLTVPEGYSANLDVSTTNGPLRLGIPVTIKGTLPGGRVRSVQAPIGSGGAPIRASTTNGPLSVVTK